MQKSENDVVCTSQKRGGKRRSIRSLVSYDMREDITWMTVGQQAIAMLVLLPYLVGIAEMLNLSVHRAACPEHGKHDGHRRSVSTIEERADKGTLAYQSPGRTHGLPLATVLPVYATTS